MINFCMNIFYLDENPQVCAMMHNDKHVVKMILEYAQLMSTCHHIYETKNDMLYKKTHVKHPSTLWVCASRKHYEYLYELFVHLCDEYTYRYGKVHMSYTKLNDVLKNPPEKLTATTWQEPFVAMPDKYKVPNDSLQSYKNYYKYGKTHLQTYTKRDIPLFLTNN